MKVLDLFSGTRSFSKVAEQRGHEVFTSDINPFEGIDYVTNIMDFDTSKVPFIPDVIWASPPCTTFSVASLRYHWNKDGTPKSEACLIGIEVARKTLEIIKYFLDKNPKMRFYIENPRGKMRKLDFMTQDWFNRHTVTYCQYGDFRMKPTDIWTNDDWWTPRPSCKNGDPCHEASPRGSSGGTQGMSGNKTRSVLPPDLCKEIIEQNENV